MGLRQGRKWCFLVSWDLFSPPSLKNKVLVPRSVRVALVLGDHTVQRDGLRHTTACATSLCPASQQASTPDIIVSSRHLGRQSFDTPIIAKRIGVGARALQLFRVAGLCLDTSRRTIRHIPTHHSVCDVCSTDVRAVCVSTAAPRTRNTG